MHPNNLEQHPLSFIQRTKIFIKVPILYALGIVCHVECERDGAVSVTCRRPSLLGKVPKIDGTHGS